MNFIDSVVLSWCLKVSPGCYPIGFGLFLLLFCLFSCRRRLFCLFVLVLWLFVSLSLWVFSFAPLSSIKFFRLDVDSFNYKKFALWFNSDNGFASDPEVAILEHN